MKNNILKNLLARFVFFQGLLLIMLLAIFSISGRYSMTNQAKLLGDSVRNSFLIRDNRNLVEVLSSSLRSGFLKIKVLDQDDKIFIDLGEIEKANQRIIASYRFAILANLSSEKSKVGEIIFYYDSSIYFQNALYVWLLIFLLTSPYLFFEKKRMEKDYQEKIRVGENELFRAMAMQVSHDIRSPLAALKISIEDFEAHDVLDKNIVTSAIGRIEDIANNLLSKKDFDESLQSEVDLEDLLEKLVAEKKIEFKKQSHIEIKFNSTLGKVEKVFTKMNSADFDRVISNLINNSVQSIENDRAGVIEVSLHKKEIGSVIIKVSDNGKGIPEAIIAKIGTRGFSFGKENLRHAGFGLGLSYAKDVINKVSGNFEIKSKEGKGTDIYIEINCFSKVSKQFDTQNIFHAVLIDNDDLVLMTWEARANKKNIKLLTMKSTKEFWSYKDKIDKALTKIYVDNELGESNMSGVDFAKILNEDGYEKIFLATGYEKEKFTHLPWLNVIGKRCPF